MDKLAPEVVAAIVRRRRIIVATLLLYEDEPGKASGPQGPKRQKTRFDFVSWKKEKSRSEFRKMFRMHKEDFDVLLRHLDPHIATEHPEKATTTDGGEITAAVKLAVALRILAGGAVWDISMAFHVHSNSACYDALWAVVDAVLKVPALQAHFPTDLDKLREIEAAFAAKSRDQTIRGLVGCLDGCIIAQKNPGMAVHNPNEYHCTRKSKFGILLSAIADTDGKFVWFDMSSTPQTHDFSAWKKTAFGGLVHDGKLPGGFFLFGDNAYVCGPSLVVPGTDDDFNFEHSSLRMCIERAFGMLIRRWGILWRPLEVKFERRAKLISACCLLHNFCIDRKLEAMNHTETWSPTNTNTGGIQRPPRMDRDGRPVEYLDATYTNSLGKGPPKELKIQQDTRLRTKLEAACRDAGLRRPR